MTMFTFLSEPGTRRGLLALAAAGVLTAGCQTSGGADPNSTLTTPGDFQALASCYARSQDTVASRAATGSDGTRSVSVTSTIASDAAADALSTSATQSAEEAVESAGVASYRVTFQEQPNNTTRVSGTTVGAATAPFTWFETVLPALRQCTSNPDLN